MKSSALFCLVFTCLLAFVAAWTKEDHEIFRLRDEVELYEGEGVTFYDIVGVKPSASQVEINKAYRKKSAQLHPDKAERNFIARRLAESKDSTKGKPQVNKKPSQREIKKAVKDAQERYQRLTVIKEILTTQGRARYDHFLKNGFPQWRSTGYYYQRFRPGLWTTLLGLWVFVTGGVHYGIIVLNYRQRKAFVERIIKRARKDALGDEFSTAAIPGIDSIGETVSASAAAPPAAEPDESMPEPRNRKERRMMEKMQAKEGKNGKSDKNGKGAAKKRSGAKSPVTESPAPSIPKRRVRALNGKELLVSSDGQVFLEEEDEEGNVEQNLLDAEAMEKPSFSQTALVQAPFWVVDFVKARISGKSE